MPKIMVTNTEMVSGGDVRLYGRTEDGEEDSITVTNFPPYFYAPIREAASKTDRLNSDERVITVEGTEKVSQIDEKRLVKVVVDKPWHTGKVAKEHFSNHYEADVWINNRLRIDHGIYTGVKAPSHTVEPDELTPVDMDVKPRVMTFDIEVDERGLDFDNLGENRIMSIVAHDSQEDEYIGFMDSDGRDIGEMFPNGCPEELDALHVENGERAMLVRFATWVDEHNPDLLTGWNSDDFDVPYLISRMENVVGSASRLSREGHAEVNDYGDVTLKGRTMYDMLDAYKASKFTELRSYTLDYVAKEELGAEKITHEMGFHEMWQEDPELMMNYNARDVRLTVEIDREAEIISFKDSLRREIGLDFDDTKANNDFIEMMARRKLHEEGYAGRTTDYSRDKSDYEGAYVFPPANGVLSNVIGIDLASLYPNTMAMINAGPESRLSGAEKAKLEDGQTGVAVTPNEAAFDLEDDTILKSLVEDALGLKSEYKKRKKEAPEGSDEEAAMAERYAVSKTIVNSLYGVVGWEKFFMYDEATAEAVTLMGQECIKRTAEYVEEETEATVAYGDTDSNYIKFPDEYSQAECLERAEKICTTLNEEVYPSLAEEFGIPAEENRWEIEIEKFMESFFQYGKKKRYAYKATWKEGMGDYSDTLDDPEYDVTGMNGERSDVSQLTKELESDVLDAILEHEGKDTIGSIVHEYAKKIDPVDPDWEYIGIPGGFSQPFHRYDSPTAHVRAAKNANEILEVNFDETDKPMRCYLNEGGKHDIDVIAYSDNEDIEPVEDEITMDATRMSKTAIERPMEGILSAVDVDVNAAMKGQTQQGLGAFI